MDFKKATNQQLLTILSEDCPDHYKQQAIIQLQSRKEKQISRQVSNLKHKAAYTNKVYRVN
ncbi:hypothetical protein J1P26_07340 [Neobacillus sp. MM2021_6]|uniref:hypothetical protein n=1 Tax=Bacillaceae TaxID=186817 RepID=UPI00140907D9|nr:MULTISPECIES: hypothetical protein [Bacillaceae]MBO0959546.1 hypothetical protein [Neobacillus sp. MM2021_6]NHC17156.1 hypothetical protein [Bacillus sp. MM2020_4]